MADEDKKIEPAPQVTPKSEDKPIESKTDVWKELTGNKFKSADELAKSYTELEKKFGTQSDEVKQAREFMQTVYPLLEEIKNDSELFKTLDERLRKKGEPKTPAKDEAKGEDKDQSGVRQITSDLLLERFEAKHGIDKLEPEERKDLRQKIGDAIFELSGTSLNNVDLRKLGTTLENAYIIAKYKSKSAASESETEDRASISSVPGKTGKGETVLTPEEAKVAEKLGLTREQYLGGKK